MSSVAMSAGAERGPGAWRTMAAVLVMVGAQLALALTVAAGRAAGQLDRDAFPGLPGAGVSEMLFFRSIPMCLVCLVLVYRRRARAPHPGAGRLPPGALRWIGVRGVVGCLGTLCYFYGGLTIPLGANQLLLSTSVFITGALAHLFIGEPYTRERVLLSLLGFAGVGMVLANGLTGASGGAPLGYAVSFLAAVFTATALFSIRKVRHIPGEYIVLGMSLVGLGTGLGGFLVQGFHAPRLPASMGLLLLSALCGTLSQFGATWAMRNAQASLVSPAQFSGPVFSMGLGAVLFAERPGPLELVGAAFALLFGVLLPVSGSLRAARFQSLQEERI